METNIIKLKEKIQENNYSEKEFLKIIGIKQENSNNMLNTQLNFTIKQANEIVKLLNLTSKEAMSIFFSNFVAEMQQSEDDLNKN